MLTSKNVSQIFSSDILIRSSSLHSETRKESIILWSVAFNSHSCSVFKSLMLSSSSYVSQFQHFQSSSAFIIKQIVQILFVLNKICIFCLCNENLEMKEPYFKYWKCKNFDDQQQLNIKIKLNYQLNFNDHCWLCHLSDHITDAEHRE